MKILIIDAQGGGIGRQIIHEIRKAEIGARITAVGTNSAATEAMLKAGADVAVTGENAVVVGCRTADVILGSLGIAIADSLFGEITPRMAVAVGQSAAEKILIPLNKCGHYVAGVPNRNTGQLISDAIEILKTIEKRG